MAAIEAPPYAPLILRKLEAWAEGLSRSRSGHVQGSNGSRQQSTPEWLALLLPWTQYKRKWAASNWLALLAGLLSEQAQSERPATRVVPILASAPDLAELPDSQAILQHIAGLCAISPRVLEEVGYARATQASLLNDLRSGGAVLLLSGLADVEVEIGNDSAIKGRIVERAGLEDLLRKLRTLGVARLVTVARGSMSDQGEAHYPYKSMLEQEGGFKARWLFRQDEVPAPLPHPTQAAQEAALFHPNGPAISQLLSLRGLRAEDEATRRDGVLRFLLPGGDTMSEPHSRCAMTFSEADLDGARQPHAAIWGEENFTQWLAHSAGTEDETGIGGHRHLLLLDGSGPSGGQGKTTRLLSLLAEAHINRLPVVYLRLDTLRNDPRFDPGDTPSEDDLLGVALLANALGGDAALRAHLYESGITLLVDGLSEVPQFEAGGWLAQVMVGALVMRAGANGNPGLAVTCRATQWLEPDEAVPGEPSVAAAVRAALSSMHVPPVQTLAAERLRDPAGYLIAANPAWEGVLHRRGLRELISYPLALGLLAKVDIGRLKRRRSGLLLEVAHEIACEGIEEGMRRAQGMERPSTDEIEKEALQKALYLERLALAMVEAGGHLSQLRALEVVAEEQRHDLSTLAQERAGAAIHSLIREGYVSIRRKGKSIRAIFTLVESWEIERAVRHVHPITLAQLRGASLLLRTDPETGSLDLEPDALRDLLAVSCLVRLRKRRRDHEKLDCSLQLLSERRDPAADTVLALYLAQLFAMDPQYLRALPGEWARRLIPQAITYLTDRSLKRVLAASMEKDTSPSPNSLTLIRAALRQGRLVGWIKSLLHDS